MLSCRVAMASSAQTEFIILRGPRSLARCAADWLLNRVLAVPGTPAVCLSGGSTPLLLYQLLAEAPWRERFPWRRVHWFWGDERAVPADDPRSNYRAARAALFDRVPIPAENIHPIAIEDSLHQTADAYERVLQEFYGASRLSDNRPLFAATLLGLGADGHTASLFPGDAALAEEQRWVAAVPAARPEPRVTLTPRALSSSGEVAFLVSGAQKREIVARLRAGAPLPPSRVRPAGRTRWFIDRAAAGTGTA